MRYILIPLFFLILTGCAQLVTGIEGVPTADPNNEADVFQKTEISYDSYEHNTTIVGPTAFNKDNMFQNSFYLIRGFKKGKPEKGFDSAQIYVNVRIGDWYFLRSAYAYGKELDFTKISQDVLGCDSYGCGLSETVGINFSEKEILDIAQDMLENKKNFDIKISGKKGDAFISITPEYMQGYLRAAGYDI
jgi:hypothetical protein